MTNLKNINPQPESSPQWDKLLFANDISEKTEKVWFEKIFGFWKEIKQFEKWTTMPTLKEIQTLFEKENREFPEITLKLMKETWKKLYDETAFKTKRAMLGYSKKQSQLDPKIVNSFYYTLQNEIDEKIEKKFNDWVETVSKESINLCQSTPTSNLLSGAVNGKILFIFRLPLAYNKKNKVI